MNYRKVVFQAMEEDSDIATLDHIYQNIPKMIEFRWQTKIPDATIKLIVQKSKILQFLKC
jgi:hypothetical protein